MDSPLALGIAVVALLVVVRHFAARRVLARQGQFVWLLFAPNLIGAVVILWAGIQTSASVPILGVLMVTLGVVYLALVMRFLTRTSRSINASGPQDDITTVLIGPFAEHVTSMMGLLLVVGVVAVVGLIVWGVTQAR